MQVSSQPYRKTYTFPLLSVAALGKLLLIVLSIALPFFVTYSTPSTFALIRFLPFIAFSHLKHAQYHTFPEIPHRNHHISLVLYLHQSVHLLILPRDSH